jgi:23S rRNA pseudouridine1911/1915/1917 synthase
LTRGDERTLIAAKPFTGRIHQIRAHLAAVGHALFGDQLYGYGDSVFGGRLALHASQLGITHPMTSAALLFEIPIQEEFNKLLRNNKDQIEGEAS